MALTKEERRLLELARHSVATGESKFVCNALKEVASKNPELRCAEKTLLAYIDQALGSDFTLLIWQQNNGVFEGGNDESLRPDRLAWIDWMLGKPLPGEQVEIIWFSKDTVHSTAEYCGREFYAKREVASMNHCVFEKTESRGMVKVCEGDDFAKINAAIVAHVWPAEKSEVL